jgi:maltose-binding protein MalE
MQVSGLMKNLPSVAALTAERDGETRKAALNTLATAYKNLGMPLDIFYLMLFYNTFLLPFLFVLSQTHSFL